MVLLNVVTGIRLPFSIPFLADRNWMSLQNEQFMGRSFDSKEVFLVSYLSYSLISNMWVYNVCIHTCTDIEELNFILFCILPQRDSRRIFIVNSRDHEVINATAKSETHLNGVRRRIRIIFSFPAICCLRLLSLPTIYTIFFIHFHSLSFVLQRSFVFNLINDARNMQLHTGCSYGVKVSDHCIGWDKFWLQLVE